MLIDRFNSFISSAEALQVALTYFGDGFRVDRFPPTFEFVSADVNGFSVSWFPPTFEFEAAIFDALSVCLLRVSVESASEESGHALLSSDDFDGLPNLGLSTATMSSDMYAGFALFQLWTSKRSIPLL